MTEPKKQRGGDRGGRRPRTGESRLVKIPDDMWQHCRAQGNASEYIRKLIDADLKRPLSSDNAEK